MHYHSICSFLCGLILLILPWNSEGNVILDRVNVDSYLQNTRMVEFHINCLLYDGQCDTIGTEMKKIIPRVASSKCAPCSSDQKQKLAKIIKHWQTRYPKAWQDMQFHINQGKYRRL